MRAAATSPHVISDSLVSPADARARPPLPERRLEVACEEGLAGRLKIYMGFFPWGFSLVTSYSGVITGIYIFCHSE